MPISDIARFSGNAVEVDAALGDNSLWLPLFEGADPGQFNSAAARNNLTGASVEFTSGEPITRMVFWAVERAVCPEPFIHIRLEPGQSRSWVTRYRFSVDARAAG